MKTSLIVTTINKPNRNIRKLSDGSKKNDWDFIVIGDRKSPKNFKLNYGTYYDLKNQMRTKLSFPKICRFNNYARKNIGYLIAIKKKTDVIVETDDDNCPKKNFFLKKKLSHYVKEIANMSWVNIYDLFQKKNLVWPRGLPLDQIFSNKIKIKNKKIQDKFYLQQGTCEKNPDVDAIYRLLNKEINIKFKDNYKISIGKSLTPFNSQNTIWFEPIFPLLYLPVTCSMRCTDIWRSLIALKILKNDNKKILYFGTTMFQDRNFHDLNSDFNLEVPMYLNNKKIYGILDKLKFKKGEKNYSDNLLIAYRALIKNKIFLKDELKYLNAWIRDLKNI